MVGDLARVAGASALLVVLAQAPALAQSQYQLWGDLTLDWAKSDRLTCGVDLEPKVLVSAPAGNPSFWTFDATPHIQYATWNWLDVTGEMLAGYTGQSNNDNSVAVTPRAGVLVHVLSRNLPDVLHVRERPPRRRVVIRDLSRIEWENKFDAGAKSGSSSTLRWRNRVEFQVPLNKPKLTDNGAHYVTSDWETFVPLDDGSGFYVDKQRIRAGVGYRRSFGWRFEALYLWDVSRKATDDSFALSDQALDIRVTRVF